jgi:hypothetical protein
MFTRTHKRLSAWLAMLAMVWGALAPTLGQAAAREALSPDSGWVEVCSTTGMVWVHLDSGAERTGEHPGGAGNAMSVMTDCALCLLHGATAGAAPVGALVLLPFHTQALLPVVPTAPALATVWPGALLRAPPLTV